MSKTYCSSYRLSQRMRNINDSQLGADLFLFFRKREGIGNDKLCNNGSKLALVNSRWIIIRYWSGSIPYRRCRKPRFALPSHRSIHHELQ
jgi:hypothetical protein